MHAPDYIVAFFVFVLLLNKKQTKEQKIFTILLMIGFVALNVMVMTQIIRTRVLTTHAFSMTMGGVQISSGLETSVSTPP